MRKKVLHGAKGKTERLEVRLSAELKAALVEYSTQNLESTMETANRAIKIFVGFGQPEPRQLPDLCDEEALPKIDRLEIRIHHQLKTMLIATRDRITVSSGKRPRISSVVLSAIIQHIGYTERALPKVLTPERRE